MPQYARYSDYMDEFTRRVAAEALLAQVKEVIHGEIFSLADASEAVEEIRELLPKQPETREGSAHE